MLSYICSYFLKFIIFHLIYFILNEYLSLEFLYKGNLCLFSLKTKVKFAWNIESCKWNHIHGKCFEIFLINFFHSQDKVKITMKADILFPGVLFTLRLHAKTAHLFLVFILVLLLMAQVSEWNLGWIFALSLWQLTLHCIFSQFFKVLSL